MEEVLESLTAEGRDSLQIYLERKMTYDEK